ncbi:hypothetical protein KCTC52924_02532 [Arenibacter antarcticus]|uniref:DUF2007 domain-containing protein n=1 Tax=Arenibacter antarcticus TaxID=2040469 RepID=A0ABW5VI44_9FLAO|nr:DUF2007 domain-containing protein [Arenibacter sp. H213]MCM4168837.1 hypothetical protein [Arenibacter sp. H213]
MVKDYIKIFSGNLIIAGRIKEELRLIGIMPVVRDESESGRLAGFASPMQGVQEIYVQPTEVDKAKPIVDQLLASFNAEL